MSQETSRDDTGRALARQVLTLEADAIRGLLEVLDESFDDAVERILACRGRVVCSGMGKSGIVMKKIAATLASTGTPSLFLHPAEAIHGDLGMIVDGDLVLAASYSGTTQELLYLVEALHGRGIPVISITGSRRSPLAERSDLHLWVPIDREACPLNLAPTASTTATLALGDALAMVVSERRGFTQEDFGRLHPGGRLGRSLLKVEQLMASGDHLPRVSRETPLKDAIYEMSAKQLGITAVTDGDRLVGCISDGDLRRLLGAGEGDGALLHRTAGECMTASPKAVPPRELAPAALKLMEHSRITSLFVCGPGDELLGILHIHSLWGLEPA